MFYHVSTVPIKLVANITTVADFLFAIFMTHEVREVAESGDEFGFKHFRNKLLGQVELRKMYLELGLVEI